MYVYTYFRIFLYANRLAGSRQQCAVFEFSLTICISANTKVNRYLCTEFHRIYRSLREWVAIGESMPIQQLGEKEGDARTRSDLYHFRQFDKEHRGALDRWRSRRQKQKDQDIIETEDTAVEEEDSEIVKSIKSIYSQHNPTGLSKVPELLEKYRGEEETLLLKLQNKYIPNEDTGPAAELGTEVFMSFRINGQAGHAVTFRLYDSATPLTCDNFRALCVGDKVRGGVFLSFSSVQSVGSLGELS